MSSTDVSQTGRQGPNLTVDHCVAARFWLSLPVSAFFLQLCTIWSIAFGPTAWALHLSPDPVDALGASAGYFFLMLAFAIGLNQYRGDDQRAGTWRRGWCQE